jgi:hypothetical protein
VQGAAKRQRRYRYYVSRTLVRGTSEGTEQGWRISAPEIEQRVAAAAQAVLGDRPAIALALEASGVDPNRLAAVLKSARAWIERLASRSEAAAALCELIVRVQLSRVSLHLSLKLPLALTDPSDAASPVSLMLSRLVPLQMKRRGVEMRIVLEGDSMPNRVDLALLKALARARRWAN